MVVMRKGKKSNTEGGCVEEYACTVQVLMRGGLSAPWVPWAPTASRERVRFVAFTRDEPRHFNR